MNDDETKVEGEEEVAPMDMPAEETTPAEEGTENPEAAM
jgi:hypothetical protein